MNIDSIGAEPNQEMHILTVSDFIDTSLKTVILTETIESSDSSSEDSSGHSENDMSTSIHLENALEVPFDVLKEEKKK